MGEAKRRQEAIETAVARVDTSDPATLRTYADIFAAPRRQGRGGPLLPPSEPCAAAALALRFMADLHELTPAASGSYPLEELHFIKFRKPFERQPGDTERYFVLHTPWKEKP
jgi:hypothetical protein